MSSSSALRRVVASALLGVLASVASKTSQAQTAGLDIALDQFEPSPAGDRFFGVPSPNAEGHVVGRGIVAFDFARKPLVVDDGAHSYTIVGGQGMLHFGASLALWNRLLFAAAMPVNLAMQGDTHPFPDVGLSSSTGLVVGDIRIDGRIRLFGEDGDRTQLGVALSVYLPTGPIKKFVGEGAARFAPALIAGGRLPRFAWAAFLRPTFHVSDNPATLEMGGAAGLLLQGGRLQVGPELRVSLPLQEGFAKASETVWIERGFMPNVEVLLGTRGQIGKGLSIGGAFGPGFGDAMGTPSLRIIATLGWSPDIRTASPLPESRRVDSDGDGIDDDIDSCPHTFAEKPSRERRPGCPLQDRDEDGKEDDLDACPDEPGAGPRGCPADRDGDGIEDSLDVCPGVAGSAVENGCPADDRK